MSDAKKKAHADAYTRPEALKAGFDLYRSFPQDEKDNIAIKNVRVSTPVLYLRGGDQSTNMDAYINGFTENGLRHVEAKIIEGCGHFTAEEAPQRVAAAVREFLSF